ncbi:MAG: hypothetical protein WCF67_06550 [Chitinophagaceae bacterium]
MLDNLVDLIRQNAGESIINNPAIPNARNDEAVKETSNSILDTLKSALAGGNVGGLMDMFAKGRVDNNNPVVQQATGNLTARLGESFGMDPQQASGVAGSLVPNVLNQLAQKTADPNDNSFNIQDIFNQLSGGKTSGFDLQGVLQKFKGKLDTDGDSDVDLQDLKGLFSGEGSVMGKMKDMLGK